MLAAKPSACTSSIARQMVTRSSHGCRASCSTSESSRFTRRCASEVRALCFTCVARSAFLSNMHVSGSHGPSGHEPFETPGVNFVWTNRSSRRRPAARALSSATPTAVSLYDAGYTFAVSKERKPSATASSTFRSA